VKPNPAEEARTALSAAIAAVADAEADVKATREAAEVAGRHARAAREERDRIRAEGAELKVDTAGLIASVRAGEDVAVGVLAPSAATRAAEEAAAEMARRWDATRDACLAELAGKERELTHRTIERDNAIKAVVRGAGVAAALLAGLEEKQKEVFDRRAALSFLVFNDLIEEPELSVAKRFLMTIQALPYPGFKPAGDDGAVERAWRTHLGDLGNDPHARIPAIAGAAKAVRDGR
jgi:hypothetical protein